MANQKRGHKHAIFDNLILVTHTLHGENVCIQYIFLPLWGSQLA